MVSQKSAELETAPILPPVPRISIIIPAYNCAQFLPETLESVFSQNYEAYEIIVVDDGSTDDLVTVLRPYTDKVRYVKQPNAGSAAARNTGLELAQGEYIVFLDADDLLLPGKLRQQVATLILKPHLGLVHSGWLFIDETGKVMGEESPWHDAPVLDLETWLRRKPIRMGAMMFRRLWLESVGGLDPDLRQSHDVDLIFRMALNGCQAEWVFRPTMAYRVHSQSTIRRNALKHREYVMRVLDKFFSHPNTPDDLRRREPLSRFYTLSWLSWHVFECGGLTDMALPLQEGWPYSPYSPVRTVWVWLQQFMHHLIVEERPSTEIKVIWQQMTLLIVPDGETLNWGIMGRLLDWWLAQQPQPLAWPFHDLYLIWFPFEVAAQQDSLQPISAEALMDWWTAVWWHVLNDDVATAVANLHTAYRHIDSKELIQILQFCLIVEHRRISLAQIQRFWQTAVAEGVVLPQHRHDVVALYLSLFGQLALEHQWRPALAAFKLALKQIWHPKTWPLWLRFARTIVGLKFTVRKRRGLDANYG